MNTTENYNLKKPEYSDYADISDFNDNMDIIDEELTALNSNSGVTPGTYGGTAAGPGGTYYRTPQITVDAKGRIIAASQALIPEAYVSKGNYYGGMLTAADYETLMTGGKLYLFTKTLNAEVSFNNTYSSFNIMEYSTPGIPNYPFISAEYIDVNTGERYPLRFRKYEKGSNLTYVRFDVEALTSVLGRSASVSGDKIIVYSNYQWTDNARM